MIRNAQTAERPATLGGGRRRDAVAKVLLGFLVYLALMLYYHPHTLWYFIPQRYAIVTASAAALATFASALVLILLLERLWRSPVPWFESGRWRAVLLMALYVLAALLFLEHMHRVASAYINWTPTMEPYQFGLKPPSPLMDVRFFLPDTFDRLLAVLQMSFPLLVFPLFLRFVVLRRAARKGLSRVLLTILAMGISRVIVFLGNVIFDDLLSTPGMGLVVMLYILKPLYVLQVEYGSMGGFGPAALLNRTAITVFYVYLIYRILSIPSLKVVTEKTGASLPPDAEPAWFFYLGEQAMGPYTRDEMLCRVHGGAITPDMLVWDGSSESKIWVTAREAGFFRT